MIKRLLCILAMTALTAGLTACGTEQTTVNVGTFQTEPITVTTAAPAEPTVLTLDTVFSSLCTSSMKWSYLQDYIYTSSADGKADFVVTHEKGELSLHVEFDEAADIVSVADLTYGDLTVSILTDDRQSAMRPVLAALSGD